MAALSLLVALSLSAPDGAAVFEKLKGLEGAWKTAAKDGNPRYVTVRLVGGGTAVLETTTGSDRTRVTSVTLYALVATRHDAAGGARLKVKDAEGGTVRFTDGSRTLTLSLKSDKLTVDLAGKDGRQSVELLREYLDTLK